MRGVTLNDVLYGWIYSNSPLNQADMQSNANLVYKYFSEEPRTPWEAIPIAAMLGNMQAESTINPGRWENGDINNLDVGYGLVQWTPASKYINWAGNTFSSGNTQCRRIEWERENNQQFGVLSVLPKYVNDALGIPRMWYEGDSSGPVDIPGIASFSDFAYMRNWPIVSYPGVYADLRQDVRYAAWCFLLQYERPQEQNQPIRAEYALAWADYLGVRHIYRLSPTFWAAIKKNRRHVKRARKEWGYFGGK